MWSDYCCGAGVVYNTHFSLPPSPALLLQLQYYILSSTIQHPLYYALALILRHSNAVPKNGFGLGSCDALDINKVTVDSEYRTQANLSSANATNRP